MVCVVSSEDQNQAATDLHDSKNIMSSLENKYFDSTKSRRGQARSTRPAFTDNKEPTGRDYCCKNDDTAAANHLEEELKIDGDSEDMNTLEFLRLLITPSTKSNRENLAKSKGLRKRKTHLKPPKAISFKCLLIILILLQVKPLAFMKVSDECIDYVKNNYFGDCPDKGVISSSDWNELNTFCCNSGTTFHCHYIATMKKTIQLCQKPFTVDKGKLLDFGTDENGNVYTSLEDCPSGYFQPVKRLSDEYDSSSCVSKSEKRTGTERVCSGGSVSDDRFTCSLGWKPYISYWYCLSDKGFTNNDGCTCSRLNCSDIEQPYRNITAYDPALSCSDFLKQRSGLQIDYECVKQPRKTSANVASRLGGQSLCLVLMLVCFFYFKGT